MPEIEPVGVGEIEQTSSDERRNLLAEQLTEVETDVVEQPEKPAGDRVRAADGKFAPKTDAAPTQAVTTAEPAQEPAWKKPPQSWKKDYHEHWGKMDPKVAEYVHAREQEMRAGVEQSLPKLRAYDALSKAVAPYMEDIKIHAGGDVAKAVTGLMQADRVLRHSAPEQKRAYLMQLAQSYGINLGDVSDAPRVVPEVYQLQQTVAQLQANIDGDKRAKEEATTRSLLNDISEFAKTHEHFDAVENEVMALLQGGLIEGSSAKEKLENAYTKAIRLKDDLYESQIAARQAEAAETRRSTKDQAAKAARSAAVSVRSSTPGTNTAPKAQDRRSRLSEQFDGLDERL